MIKSPARIGIILDGKLDKPPLRYLISHLNTIQDAFEYEILPYDEEDIFIKCIFGGSALHEQQIYNESTDYVQRQKDYCQGKIRDAWLSDDLPPYLIAVTMSQFKEQYYAVPNIHGKFCIIALGDWESNMAPPSIIEFIIIFIICESIFLLSPLKPHFGTKGCLFDYTDSLSDARYKVLNRFLCSQCLSSVEESRRSDINTLMQNTLQKDWLGDISKASSPAGIVKKLGYDLFVTKGIVPTFRELIVQNLQTEGVKQIVTIVGSITLAALLLYLGLKTK